MKVLLNFFAALVLLSSFGLTACRKTYAPPTPEEGGKFRLAKVFRNDQLYRQYEYSDTGRLLRTSFEPGRSTAETAEFTYDNTGRIVSARKEHPFSGIYILSEVFYNSDNDLERRTEKVFRTSNNELLGQYQTDIAYASIPNIGRRVTVVTRLLPSGPLTSREIYSYYFSNDYPKLQGSLKSLQKANFSDSAVFNYVFQSGAYTEDTPPVNAQNPYQYANTYGYELVKPSVHVPSHLLDDYYRNGSILYGGTTYYSYTKINLDNLIEQSTEVIDLPNREREVVNWKYEYIKVK
jgi:hypothetical protein